MTNDQKKTLCAGCRDNFYNIPGNSTTGECWLLANAKPVERTSVGTWQNPPYHWQPQQTLSCHHPEGRHWIKDDDPRLDTDPYWVAKRKEIDGALGADSVPDAKRGYTP
jgi:hypothetical protein